jgi:hypothetical protein
MGDNDDEFQPGIDNGYEKNRGFSSPSVKPKYWCQNLIYSAMLIFFLINPLRCFLINLTTLSIKESNQWHGRYCSNQKS